MNPYETDKLLQEYLLFHYGTEEDTLGSHPGPREAVRFAQRCVGELLDAGPLPPDATALDLGCAVGRSSFELTRYCERVIGIDFSGRFIEAALQLKHEGAIMSHKVEEGDRMAPFHASLPADVHPGRVHFEQGDAMNLRPDLPAGDVVLAANLLCRLSEPQRFLDRLPDLVKPGGQLLLATPFTWMTEFTPRRNWLVQDGDSFTALRHVLEPSFLLQATCDLPFLIREHARKFQYAIALGSRWIRR